MSSDETKKALIRTSYTAYEDWRPNKGWVWFGRYFKDDQAESAISFLHQVIYSSEASSHSSKSGKTEAAAVGKVRIGQSEFRREIELWGRKCALTRSRVVPALDAAHIVSWAENESVRRSTENGLALLSSLHKIFEEGLISFGDDGTMLAKLDESDLASVGLQKGMKLFRPLTSRQKAWMRAHRRRHGYGG
ncbi:hypothetical protein ABH994_008097 [Bradyrhizobium yuanmingense]|uniref:HNH nuclease domain-containing protein n=1 Tax=Bradyrhizobium yuanmingense TaxID=108015 RepID=A0ABV4G6Z6_9BRAD|nr:HNH endonuclease signature motif containing protein [Bradyrhizobium yuanmingense]